MSAEHASQEAEDDISKRIKIESIDWEDEIDEPSEQFTPTRDRRSWRSLTRIRQLFIAHQATRPQASQHSTTHQLSIQPALFQLANIQLPGGSIEMTADLYRILRIEIPTPEDRTLLVILTMPEDNESWLTSEDHALLNQTSHDERSLFRRCWRFLGVTPYDLFNEVVIRNSTDNFRLYAVPNMMLSKETYRAFRDLLCIPFIRKQHSMLILALHYARDYRHGQRGPGFEELLNEFPRNSRGILDWRLKCGDTRADERPPDLKSNQWGFIRCIPQAFTALDTDGPVGGPHGDHKESAITLLDIKTLQLAWDIFARQTTENRFKLRRLFTYVTIAKSEERPHVVGQTEIALMKKNHIIAWKKAQAIAPLLTSQKVTLRSIPQQVIVRAIARSLKNAQPQGHTPRIGNQGRESNILTLSP